MSILDELYQWYVMDHPESQGDQKVRERFCDQWEKADQVLNEDFAEELRSSMFAYMVEEGRCDFKAGFRLGALLMQELYSPAAPTSTGTAPRCFAWQ